MKLTSEETKQYVKIDKNALDQNIAEQSEVYDEICRQQALAQNERDRIKVMLADFEAEETIKVRSTAEQMNQKVTEATVAAMVRTSDNRIKLSNMLLVAEANLQSWNGAKDSFSQRSYMLSLLVNLHVSGYFVKSNLGTPSKEAYEKGREVLAAHRRNISQSK